MAIVKAVSFKNSEDELIKFIDGKDFSYYVKELIRKDMKESYEQTKPIKRKNINFEF